MALKIEIVIFWVLTPYSDTEGYKAFGGPCYLHVQGQVLHHFFLFLQQYISDCLVFLRHTTTGDETPKSRILKHSMETPFLSSFKVET